MTAPSPRVVRVTPAQRQLIAAWMPDGADAAVVANRLGITLATVNNRFSTMLRNFDYPNRAALALALERGQVKLRVVDRRIDR